MDKDVVMQFLALSLYVLFTGFCFCDGFDLPVSKKIVWGGVFLLVSLYVQREKGELDISWILPVPTLVALLFCYRRKKRMRQ